MVSACDTGSAEADFYVDSRAGAVTANRRAAARAAFALRRWRSGSAEKTCPGSPAVAPRTAAAPRASGRHLALVRASCGAGTGPSSVPSGRAAPARPADRPELPGSGESRGIPHAGMSRASKPGEQRAPGPGGPRDFLRLAVSPQRGQMAESRTSPMPCFSQVFCLLPTKEKRGFLLFLYGIWQIRLLSETAFRFELQKTSYPVDVLQPKRRL